MLTGTREKDIARNSRHTQGKIHGNKGKKRRRGKREGIRRRSMEKKQRKFARTQTIRDYVPGQLFTASLLLSVGFLREPLTSHPPTLFLPHPSFAFHRIFRPAESLYKYTSVHVYISTQTYMTPTHTHIYIYMPCFKRVEQRDQKALPFVLVPIDSHSAFH